MNNDNQIKKLRKLHIWPSFVFLIISVVIMLIALLAYSSNNFQNIISERMYSSTVRAENIFERFEAAGSGNEKELLEKLFDIGIIENDIFIYDEEGKVITGKGVETYYDSPTQIGKESVDTERLLYADRSEDNIIKEDGSFIKNLTFTLIERGNENGSAHDEVSAVIYWIKGDISGGRTIMLKAEAPIYISDMINFSSMFLILGGLYIVSLLMFFLNVIIGVFNQRRMSKLLYTNTITGAKNMIYFEHAASRWLRSSSYIFVDFTIRKYNSYCSYHGVHAGEALLKDVSQKLLDTAINKRELSVLSGKSSYAMMLKYSSREEAEKRVNDLVNSFTKQYEREGIIFHAGIFFMDDKDTPVMMRKKGTDFIDPAVYYNCAAAARLSIVDDNVPAVAIYDEKLLEEQIWEHKVGEKMEDALKNNEFQVYIQPKYDPVNEELSGAEALVRWINDEDGFISPGRFIPIFEKNGFITKLDDFMLDQVAKLQSEWLGQGKKAVPISVNVSRAHFSDPDLASHICGIVDKYNVPHNYIEIELTESAFFDEKDKLLKTVNELRRLGFEISMDDFGAGYSSLNSLKDLPLDVLKLDADFFRGENSRDRGEIVVAQAIALAKKLNMRIVAEGIEQKEQVDFLAKQGCDMIQGFYYAKPMPADEYAQRLSENTAAEEEAVVPSDKEASDPE